MLKIPVILFVYNRPVHTKKTITALRKNIGASETPLIIYSDAAKTQKDTPNVNLVRKYCKEINGFENVTLIERPYNFGLAKSISEGVTETIAKFGKVIVLEDDLETSPYFLLYMNTALEKYSEDKRVMHVNGYCPPIETGSEKDTFFYRVTQSWGWGTWSDRWKKYNNNSAELLDTLHKKKLLSHMDIDDTFHYSSTLKANARNDISTWAVKWYASCIRNEGLSLYPTQSLVQNIGNDNTGTNAKKTSQFQVQVSTQEIPVMKKDILETDEIKMSMVKYYKSLKPNLFEKVLLRLKFWYKKI